MAEISSLEKKRKQTEIIRVAAAKAEMEFQIEEKLDQIERIKKNMEIQDARISQLKQELGD